MSININISDPVRSAQSHVIFEETANKIIARTKRSSKYHDEKYRSFAYKNGSSKEDAKSALCLEFFYKKMMEN